jgi:hypothetical protein
MIICDFCKKETRRSDVSDMFNFTEVDLYDVCKTCNDEFTEIMTKKRDIQRQEIIDLRTEFIDEKTS